MKFGKIFRSTVESRMPQWRDYVINYKQLKQSLKQQLAQGTQSYQDEDIALAFTSVLDGQTEKVNNFFMERVEEGVILLSALQQYVEQIQRSGCARAEMRMACQRSLVTLHFQLLLLQNYVALNFTALTKILKKFEKKFGVEIRNDYINAIVELPFYRCDALGELVEETERQFHVLESLGSASPSKPPSQPQAAADASSAAAAAMPPPPPPHAAHTARHAAPLVATMQ